VLVGDRLWSQTYFQEAITRGTLRDRNWTRHTATLRVRRLILAVPMSFQRANFEYALHKLDAPAPRPSERRIFLGRSQRRSRALLNQGDLLPSLQEGGFEIVDTDELTLGDQMALFGAARVVVGNHGAGLANLIFRIGQPVELVELFSPEFIRPHFISLAEMCGFGYDAVVGESEGGQGNFRINPAQFRAVITRAVARIQTAQS
jgi:capsular polysaccharide biosynthesis protein